MWGFEAKRARKFTRTSPRTLPFFFHYHAFCAPERSHPSEGSCRPPKMSQNGQNPSLRSPKTIDVWLAELPRDSFLTLVGVPWARETGAICQIGVLTQKRCIFWAQKRLFCGPCLCPNATKQSSLAKIHFLTRSQSMEGKITIFTVLKWGKGRNHYNNHDLGHNHWQRSAKRPKIDPFWTQNVHGFQVRTPIWQMAPISRINWGVPLNPGTCLINPPGANPLVAERPPWRSSQSCVTGGQQPIGNPYRFLSFPLHTWQPPCDPNWGTFQWPQPPRFSQKYCDTNGRRIAIQMGGVLRYKWEEYWQYSLSSERRGTKSTAVQMGGVLQYKWEVYCDTFLRSSGGWGFWRSSDQ